MKVVGDAAPVLHSLEKGRSAKLVFGPKQGVTFGGSYISSNTRHSMAVPTSTISKHLLDQTPLCDTEDNDTAKHSP